MEAVSLTPEQELWAVALHMRKQHGDDAPRVIAERIGALALAGDTDGVNVWRGVAALLDQLNAAVSGGRQ